ncbi:unnamed protein product [Orchesella dallaii]|uniref:Uncharacterized protein n=1 Tax=Orchesella dallaii TaxID=48710 RepID=A0ABP1PPM1_9HEXA
MGYFRTLMISAILFVLAQASVRNHQSSESKFVNALIVSAGIGNSGISKMSSIAVFENGLSPASEVALIQTQTGSLETNEATNDHHGRAC